MRIIFRSEERYRGPLYAAPPASVATMPLTAPAGQAPAEQPTRIFAMRETVDVDEALRLTLLGDLDLTAAEVFSARLAELKAAGRPTRLDLSRLAFIDSSGIQALLLVLTDARWTGWPLEVAPAVSPTVERAAQVVGIAQVLWPPETEPTRSEPATTRPAGTA
jgi:anti-anti-sigma factor